MCMRAISLLLALLILTSGSPLFLSAARADTCVTGNTGCVNRETGTVMGTVEFVIVLAFSEFCTSIGGRQCYDAATGEPCDMSVRGIGLVCTTP